MTHMLRVAFATMAVVALATQNAYALCGSDYWGGRTNFLTKLGETKIAITAVTSIHHPQTHSGCTGQMGARALLKRSPFTSVICTSPDGTKTHTETNGGASSDQVQSQAKTCTGLPEGYYASYGQHWGFGEAIYSSPLGDTTDLAGETYACTRPSTCGLMQWDAATCECAPPENCPLIVDPRGDGVELTSVANGVLFDFDGRGALDRLAWTAWNTDDAFLVLDPNGNGKVDGSWELFSNTAEQSFAETPTGFLALSQFDELWQGGNADGQISRADSVFPRLLLWTDRNHDGQSDATELQPLEQTPIQGIELSYRESQRRDRFGNLFRYRAVLSADKKYGHWIYDVFLRGVRQ